MELTNEQKAKIEAVQYDYTNIPFGDEFLDIRIEQARNIAELKDGSKQFLFKQIYNNIKQVQNTIPKEIAAILKNLKLEKDTRGTYIIFNLVQSDYNIIYKFARNQVLDFSCNSEYLKLKVSNSLNMYGTENWSIAIMSKDIKFCIAKLAKSDGKKGYEMKVTAIQDDFYYIDDALKYNIDLNKCLEI